MLVYLAMDSQLGEKQKKKTLINYFNLLYNNVIKERKETLSATAVKTLIFLAEVLIKV